MKVDKFGDGEARFVVESLRFYQNGVVETSPEGVKFRLFPGKMMNFRIEISGKEAEIMAGKIVFEARITEKNEQFHRIIIA